MKVVLCQDVPNLGHMGATVNVTSGYARNFLIPRKLAVQTDSASGKQIEHEMRIIKRREEQKRAELTALAKQIEGITVDIRARAGEEDKLFGSVTNVQIAEKLHEAGFDIDRKTIVLEEPIKALGIYTVPVRMGRGVEANVKVWVQAEQVAAAADTEASE